MTSVTFPTSLGGSGVTISDDADPSTGLLNGGHRDRFVPALKGTVDMAQYVYQYAAKIDGAAEDAERAENARGYVEAYAGALKNNLHQYYGQFATLGLNFARGKYLVDDGELSETTNASEILSVVRASPKWVEGPNGYLREVAPNTIARQWRNGVCQGALIEEERTNLLLWSEDFTNAVWSKSGVMISNDAAVGPDGTMSADKIIPDATGGRYVVQAVEVADNTTCIFSVFAKAAEYNSIRLNARDKSGSYQSGFFNLVTGIGEHVAVTGERLAGGWWKVSLRVESVAGTAPPAFYLYPADDGVVAQGGDGTSGIYIWGAQLEEGGQPSSYISTTDTPVTRAADNISRELGGDYNQGAGTVFVEFHTDRIYNLVGTIWEANVDNNNRVGIYHDSNGNIFTRVRNDGVNYDTPSKLYAVGKNRAALSFQDGEPSILAVNGATAAGPVADIPTVTTEGITGNGGALFVGTKSVITRLPFSVSDAELAEKTQ